MRRGVPSVGQRGISFGAGARLLGSGAAAGVKVGQEDLVGALPRGGVESRVPLRRCHRLDVLRRPSLLLEESLQRGRRPRRVAFLLLLLKEHHRATPLVLRLDVRLALLPLQCARAQRRRLRLLWLGIGLGLGLGLLVVVVRALRLFIILIGAAARRVGVGRRPEEVDPFQFRGRHPPHLVVRGPLVAIPLHLLAQRVDDAEDDFRRVLSEGWLRREEEEERPDEHRRRVAEVRGL